jgi:hypothetical protein
MIHSFVSPMPLAFYDKAQRTGRVAITGAIPGVLALPKQDSYSAGSMK